MKYLIPLIPSSQTLTVSMNNVNYDLSIIWRAYAFFMDIASEGIVLAEGIPLLTGVNLTDQIAYVGIPALSIITDSSPEQDPTYYTLGITSNLIYEQ